MGAGRTFLGGWAVARGGRPHDGGASRSPNSSPKLGGQASTAAERREGARERHHGLAVGYGAAQTVNSTWYQRRN